MYNETLNPGTFDPLDNYYQTGMHPMIGKTINQLTVGDTAKLS